MADEGKREKSSVDYSLGHVDGDHCGACRFFSEPDACRLVKGRIDPRYWCRLFKRKA